MKSFLDLNSIETKQAYVYNNIFEGDYDIEAFAEYLAQQGPQYTSNLQELSYDQIKNSVDAFMEKNHNLKPKPKQNNTERESMMTQSKFQRLSVDYNDMDFYMKTKQCIKEINKFALTSIQVNVISFRKNQGNFLRRDYITFKIELPQLHKQIDRRYSHFEWLRDILTYFHPGVIVPPLPKKKMKKIFTQNHLKKKGRMLQNFLRKSLQIPDLRNDQNLYKFLTIQTHQKFQDFIKDNKVQKGSAPFEKIKSANGQIEYGINQESIKINKEANEYFQKFAPFMKQFYKEIKRVKEALDTCATHLDNLEKISKKFVPIEAQFRRDCSKKQFFDHDEREKSFIDTISVMAEKYKYFLVKLRQQLKAMTQVWDKQLYAKMKSEFHHSDHIINFINEYRADERKFCSLKDSLKKKKIKLYSKQMSEWGLSEDKVTKFLNEKPSFNEAAPFMIWKKTQEVSNAEEMYALQTKQLCNSIVNYAKNNNLYNLKTVERFLQKQYQIEAEWSQKLKEMITNKLQFSLTEVNKVKEKLQNTTGNSIKGFFSQFNTGKQKETEKGYNSVIENNQTRKIHQVGDVYLGM